MESKLIYDLIEKYAGKLVDVSFVTDTGTRTLTGIMVHLDSELFLMFDSHANSSRVFINGSRYVSIPKSLCMKDLKLSKKTILRIEPCNSFDWNEERDTEYVMKRLKESFPKIFRENFGDKSEMEEIKLCGDCSFFCTSSCSSIVHNNRAHDKPNKIACQRFS